MSASVSSIIANIAAAGKTFDGNEVGARERLIDLGRELVASLEYPSEFLKRTFWAEPALSANIRLATQVSLFQHLRDAGEDGIAPQDLASKTGVDTPLLERIMRHFFATKVVTFDQGKFRSTPLSDGLAAENFQRSIDYCYDVVRPAFNEFPSLFKSQDYKMTATSLTNGPFQAAHKTHLPMFEWITANPPHLAEFDAMMSATRAGSTNWCDEGFYPMEERLFNGFDPNHSEVLLVDVGGGKGYTLMDFAERYPSHPGTNILQDRKPTVDSIEAKDQLPFECQVHDFFTPQPIKAARAYFLRSILHDWGDEDAIAIIENLKPALKEGYSRVLLNEIVVSEERPALVGTTFDMTMLAHFAVKERTERQLREILEKAGLKIVKIYSHPGAIESLVEAKLA